MKDKKDPFDDLHLLTEAISMAARAHDKQYRKDKVTPYISHPYRVGWALHNVLGVQDPEVLAAAVLHDTIEDTQTDYDDLYELSPRVAQLVAALSKDKRMPRPQREAQYEQQLRQGGAQVLAIKLADMIDNMLSTPADNRLSWQKLYTTWQALADRARQHYPRAASYIQNRFRQYGFGG